MSMVGDVINREYLSGLDTEAFYTALRRLSYSMVSPPTRAAVEQELVARLVPTNEQSGNPTLRGRQPLQGRHIAEFTLALRKLELRNTPLLISLAHWAARLPMEPMDAGETLFTFLNHKLFDEEVLRTLLERIRGHERSLREPISGQVLRSIVMCGWENDPIFDALCDATVDRIGQMHVREFGALISSLQAAQRQHTVLFNHCAAEAVRFVPAMSPTSLADLAFFLDKFNVKTPDVVDTMYMRATETAQNFDLASLERFLGVFGNLLPKNDRARRKALAGSLAMAQVGAVSQRSNSPESLALLLHVLMKGGLGPTHPLAVEVVSVLNRVPVRSLRAILVTRKATLPSLLDAVEAQRSRGVRDQDPLPTALRAFADDLRHKQNKAASQRNAF